MSLSQPYAHPGMAGASDEHGAVAVFMTRDSKLWLWNYAPSSLGEYRNRAHLDRLYRRACANLFGADLTGADLTDANVTGVRR